MRVQYILQQIICARVGEMGWRLNAGDPYGLRSPSGSIKMKFDVQACSKVNAHF